MTNPSHRDKLPQKATQDRHFKIELKHPGVNFMAKVGCRQHNRSLLGYPGQSSHTGFRVTLRHWSGGRNRPIVCDATSFVQIHGMGLFNGSSVVLWSDGRCVVRRRPAGRPAFRRSRTPAFTAHQAVLLTGTALVTGTAQWLFVLRRIPRGGWWPVVTAVGGGGDWPWHNDTRVLSIVIGPSRRRSRFRVHLGAVG